MYLTQPSGNYYYGYAPPPPQMHWYVYGANQEGGPKIVELEPSEWGGARSQIDSRSELFGYRRYDVLLPPDHQNQSKIDRDSTTTNSIGRKRYSTLSETQIGNMQIDEPIVSRRLGQKTNLEETTMSRSGGNRQMKARSWKEVNDDVSARMIAASSDSPPIIPKRDYDHSPAPSLPRPNRSVSSNGGHKRYQNEEENRPEIEWPPMDEFGRPSPYMENGYGPPPPPGGQMVLYTGGPPPPPPPPHPMMFPNPHHHHPEPMMFPPPPPGSMAMMPFGPPMLLPPDLYGYGGMPPPPFGPMPPPPPPMFMEGPPPMMMHPDMHDGIYGPPPPPPMFMHPPPPPGHFIPPMMPMDFEMFMWNQQKNNKKKGKKPPKRSKSMEYLIPPPPHMMAPPPPFVDDQGQIYGAFPPPPLPPPRPPLPLALPPPPPPPMTNLPPPQNGPPPIPYTNTSVKKQALNGGNGNGNENQGFKSKSDHSNLEKGQTENKKKDVKQSTCYLMCCKGFTQILWIIIGIILIGLVLGLVLGLTLV